MKILGYHIPFTERDDQITIKKSRKRVAELQASYFFRDYPHSPYEHTQNVNIIPFDGEKTPYELGTPFDTYPDYYTMRIRAWDAFLKTEVVQNAIRKYCLWIIGSGLKFSCEPVEKILSSVASEEELQSFIETAETRFRLYIELNESVYSEEHCLHLEAIEALKNALIAGDVLCINRYKNDKVTLETIDGRHVQTPVGTEYIDQAENRGNRIINGVEINSRGSHVAYYIASSDYKPYTRVLAYGSKTKRRQAWLMYGNKHRKSDIRGMSLLAQVLETTSKMDRYKEASLGSAEENAKIPYTVKHNQFSSGENPITQGMMAAFGKGKGVTPESITQEGDAIATKIAQTTDKMVFNLPIGSELDRNPNNSDLHFKDFYGINLDLVYTTLNIPPEVAQDKFGGSYSGSRAALKSWEHKSKVDRKNIMQRQFYQPFYDFWLDISVLRNEIQAPGYLAAIQAQDFMILGAYRYCRFIGPLVPHIDPVKEVNAIRSLLGKKLENVPLSTVEQQLEQLNTGDIETVMNKLSYEKDLYDEFIVPDQPVNNNQGNGAVPSS